MWLDVPVLAADSKRLCTISHSKMGAIVEVTANMMIINGMEEEVPRSAKSFSEIRNREGIASVFRDDIVYELTMRRLGGKYIDKHAMILGHDAIKV